MTEPSIVAFGSGWRVLRVGRSAYVQVDAGEVPHEVRLPIAASDMQRTAALGYLRALTLTTEQEQAAFDAMGAEWCGLGNTHMAVRA